MKKISLQDKKSHYEQHRLLNYQASMRLEGMVLPGTHSSKQAAGGLSREEVLKKYRNTTMQKVHITNSDNPGVRPKRSKDK